MDNFIEDCQGGLSNIEYSSDSPYELFFRCEYGISDPSSIAVEAIQFGVKAFVFDIPRVQSSNVFREFPGLIVDDSSQARTRILEIENGLWRYPIENFKDLVDMSGMVFFDRVRRDMGLPARQESIQLV